jgi:hypothetical protein
VRGRMLPHPPAIPASHGPDARDKIESLHQRPIGFGKCQQRTLAELIGQLIYPFEIIQNTLPLELRKGLNGSLEAGQQLGGDSIPIDAFREPDIPLLKVVAQVRRPNMTQKARQAEAHARSLCDLAPQALVAASTDFAAYRYAQAQVHPSAFVQSRIFWWTASGQNTSLPTGGGAPAGRDETALLTIRASSGS